MHQEDKSLLEQPHIVQTISSATITCCVIPLHLVQGDISSRYPRLLASGLEKIPSIINIEVRQEITLVTNVVLISIPSRTNMVIIWEVRLAITEGLRNRFTISLS